MSASAALCIVNGVIIGAVAGFRLGDWQFWILGGWFIGAMMVCESVTAARIQKRLTPHIDRIRDTLNRPFWGGPKL